MVVMLSSKYIYNMENNLFKEAHKEVINLLKLNNWGICLKVFIREVYNFTIWLWKNRSKSRNKNKK